MSLFKPCFLLLVILFGAFAHADGPRGSWENATNGDIMGLTLIDGKQCSIYVERALQKRSVRACKYEPFEDRYLVFLVNEQGVCGSEADFEFVYEAQAPLIRLLVGQSEIILQQVVTQGD